MRIAAKKVGGGPSAWPWKTSLILLAITVLPLLAAAVSPALADDAGPTQEQVFKSISNNVDSSVDSRKLMAGLAAVGGVVILLVVITSRQQQQGTPQKLNHQGRLMKELMKETGLTRSQAKALKARADQLAAAGRPLNSPVTLLLCPSLVKPASKR